MEQDAGINKLIKEAREALNDATKSADDVVARASGFVTETLVQEITANAELAKEAMLLANESLEMLKQIEDFPFQRFPFYEKVEDAVSKAEEAVNEAVAIQKQANELGNPEVVALAREARGAAQKAKNAADVANSAMVQIKKVYEEDAFRIGQALERRFFRNISAPFVSPLEPLDPIPEGRCGNYTVVEADDGLLQKLDELRAVPPPDPPKVRSMGYKCLPTDRNHIEALSNKNLESVISKGIDLCDRQISNMDECKTTKAAREKLMQFKRSKQKELLGDIGTGGSDGMARMRREEVWNDSMREAAIAGDRLYAFARQLSGTIHESVDAVCVVDESMLVKQQKDRQVEEQRLSMAASQQYMQLVSNVFRSVINESGLTLGINDKRGIDGEFGELKVVSNTLRKQVSDLASGSSGGEGFFTNSVKLENLLAQGSGEMTLNGLFDRLREVGIKLQEAALYDAKGGRYAQTPSLEFLSSPRNSLILRWKPEAHAAIRQAFDTFQREMLARQRMNGTCGWLRKVSAYELIEGRSDELTMAFATYCAHTLAHQRLFSAGQAAYLGQWAARANIAAMRFACDKLISVATDYATFNRRPDFVSKNGWSSYFDS